jgi:uncharacterized membrane protein
MNPFSLKSALLAKHAQHVVLVHFPIALFLAGVAFDLAAYWTKDATKKETFTAAAYLNLLAAAIFVLPTLATGLIAWQWQFAGQRLKGLLLLHLVMGSASAVLICLVGWIHFRQHNAVASAPRSYRLPLELLTTLVVSLTGHLGGFLSGVNLPG